MANAQNLKPWKPGQSGNPAGRPVGAVSLSSRIQRMMTDERFTARTLRRRGHTGRYVDEPVDAIIKTAIIKAMSGDHQWANWLVKNGYR